jgi:tetratricopeptide (TPR) repeat protein
LSRRHALLLALVTLLGLGLRLLVWRWRELQPLGGDEQEYLNAALTLLRERRYTELQFMRPPLYPIFLAASIYAVDSLVQNLRLVQALISAATVPFVYLLTLEAAWGVGRRGPASRRAALLAALLAALSYTLAANAAELLTETLFLFGLTVALWLLLRAGRLGSWGLAALAGLSIGALCLVRSVALPLLPLGALWLVVNATCTVQPARAGTQQRFPRWLGLAVRQLCIFTFAFCIVLLPWTARNYVTYGGLIVIDTTGAENLWLDNDPAGREAVKAQLYALGEDRLLRQQLGSRNGAAAILADPGRFAAKAGGELLKFFALEYSDDMRARPAIWVRPADVWLRLALGDALWLAVLLAGSYGLARGLLAGSEQPAAGSQTKPSGVLRSTLDALRSPAWLLAPWALYVLLTTLIFHVELRYRLPLFPALLPFAALTLAGGGGRAASRPARLLPLALPALALALTLLHVSYPALAWQLGWKHWQLARAEAALGRGDLDGARKAAGAALALDERSALARVALARAELAAGRPEAAPPLLDAALAAIPDHPLAHVVRGDLRRLRGDAAGAGADLGFENATQQDLQAWGWAHFATPPPARLDLGGGLDLGFLHGFQLRRPDLGDEGFRWTRGEAALRLTAPAAAREVVLRLASGRPDGSAAQVELVVNGAPAGSFSVGAAWQEIAVPVPAGGGAVVVELRAPTFRPRAFDPASPDGRELGVRVDWAEAR